MRHTQTWWDYRHLSNILFVHFNDLLHDLAGEIRRIATFLDIEISAKTADIFAEVLSFASMKRNAAKIIHPGQASARWKGGMETFFYKGTNGRWQGILSTEELERYRSTASKVLSPDCAQWLERGGAVF